MAILCATNFSPESLDATRVATELARLRGDELWLLYVLPANIARAFGDHMQKTAEETLRAEAADARKAGIIVTPICLTGSVHVELPRFVAEKKIALVIAGDSRKPRSFSGTGVLSRLAEQLAAPLWVVREPKAALAWIRGDRALKVMIGMDRTHSTDVAVRWLSELQQFGRLEVVGTHVFWPAVEYHRLGLVLPNTWDELRPELIETMHRELVERLPPSLCQRVMLEPAIGRPSDRLNTLAEEEHADLLVLGTHRRNAIARLWGTADQCLQLASMSVLCIPSDETDRPAVRIPRIDRVLAATDFSTAGNRAVAYSLSILDAGGTADLVHVVAIEPSAAARRQLLDQLLGLVPPAARSEHLTVRGHIEVGPDPATAIVTAAERHTSHVICVGSRGDVTRTRGLFGSTAQGVLNASRRPVLVVRPLP